MPGHSFFLPRFVPLEFASRFYEILHFHLFKFAHTEYKLTCNDFISKCFSGLSNSKRNFHSTGFLDIKEVYKNPLSRFGTKINDTRVTGHGAQFSFKHKVELAYIRPVF